MMKKPMNPSIYDRRLVEVMAKWRVPIGAIASEIGCDSKTLHKHFSAELELAQVNWRCDLVMALARKAERGNLSAIKLWFKMFGPI